MTAVTPESGFHEQVRHSAGRLTWLGIALIALGIAALVFPAVSTLVATVFVGWLLILSGILTVLGAFQIRGTGPFFGALLFGLLSLAAGAFMLVRPLAGELAITLTLGFLFMLQGANEAFLAFEVRPARAWGWMLVSAICSVVLSIAIVVGLPGISLVALGIIIGVNFITSGVAYAFVGATVKSVV
jgi:uncharacterized membrane protein HdeD (DUF308 family)